MNIKNVLIGYTIYFCLIFIISLIISYLWNLICHGASIINWSVPITIAFIFSLFFPPDNSILFKRNKNGR